MITPLPLELAGVAVDIDGVRIVVDGSLSAPAGSVIGLIGPNGCGKSTLLRTVYRALPPSEGSVRIGDTELWGVSAREAALHSAVMLQDDAPEFEFTVREAVGLGRVPHQRAFLANSMADELAIAESMDRVRVTALADRLVSTLSGGERQRAYLARALAQRTPVVVLDEPTNHLDVRAQIELTELVAALPATVVMALHDLSLAAACCDQLYLMSEGRVVAHGAVPDVLDPDLLESVYGVPAALGSNPLTGTTTVHFGRSTPHPEKSTA